MPKDKGGKFHFSQQQASHADKGSMGKPTPSPMKEAPTEKPMDGGGEDHIGKSLMEQASADGGKHMYVKAHDMGGYTSHHVGHDGNVEGPHDHENMDALKNHMSQFFDEEGAEGEGGGMPMAHHGAPPLHGM